MENFRSINGYINNWFICLYVIGFIMGLFLGEHIAGRIHTPMLESMINENKALNERLKEVVRQRDIDVNNVLQEIKGFKEKQSRCEEVLTQLGLIKEEI